MINQISKLPSVSVYKLYFEYWHRIKLIILIIKITMSPSVSNQGVLVWVVLLDPAS